ncbi:acetate--CoA ligase family protein [Variovorax saccharolyticus]|uniref:acetate--CoA ligase family protein n=1 Tax=Variovorax saccharolyticus TaxID=3053516 RepID=UPI0025776FAD|nr:acetate--CoA ligase family protein [Variovorax sp. J22R187]MDM0019116.1 acetate--CoA ligase family protein [Variovorax sp. J22R187]
MTKLLDPRLQRAFAPRRIAVVGATEDRNKVGGRPLHYLQRFGFQGAVYPINPGRTTVQGLDAYPSLAATPEAPDVAIVAVGQDAVAGVIDQCAARGVGTAIVMSSGFGETGAEGLARQQALVAQAHRLGIRLVGPNAQGVANFQTGAVMNFSTMFMEIEPRDGPVAIVSQSGAASVMPYAMLRERGVGVRYLVASGNDADASVCELALTAAADPEVRVVLMYIESLRDPAMLAEVARLAAARGAAVIALKSGRSAHGAKAAASHTGAIVNDDVVVDAFFERHGIWRANDVQGLVNAVELYLGAPPRAAEHLVVMSHSGAVGVLCADAADTLGLPLAELGRPVIDALAGIMPSFATAQNPVDLTASLMTQGGMYADTLGALAADPQADMFLVGVPVAGEGYDVPGMARDTARFAQARNKPCVVSAPQASVRQAFREAGVPVFSHETDAVDALHQWSRHGMLMQQAAARHALPAPAMPAPALPDRDGPLLSEADSLALLAACGIPTVPLRLCRSADEAVAAWQALGPQVVVKACSARIPHKSEHGLVFIDVQTAEQVRQAWTACAERVAAIDLPLDGVIVAQRVRGRREFALGVRQDPLFGTVVMVSDGGKYVEALRDFVVLLHPFSESDVMAKLARLRIAPILAGVRGEAPMDLGVVARAAVALGALAAAHPQDIASIDLNPLIVGDAGQGGWAVDAVIERQGASHAAQ